MHAKWHELASADYRFVTHISSVYLAATYCSIFVVIKY